MTAQTRGVLCPADEWTLLSEGKTKVLAAMRNVGWGHVVTAAAEPAEPPGEDYVTISSTRPISLQFDDDTTNVYFWPFKVSVTVEVITE